MGSSTFEAIEDESTLVVPVYIAFHDPAKGEGGRRRKGPDPKEVGNAMLRGQTLLSGKETAFRFETRPDPSPPPRSLALWEWDEVCPHLPDLKRLRRLLKG